MDEIDELTQMATGKYVDEPVILKSDVEEEYLEETEGE